MKALTPIEMIPRAERTTSPRFLLLRIIFAGCIVVLLGRSFWLQIIQGPQFLAAAEDNHITHVPLVAPRGLIFDYQQRQLLENVPSSDILLDPQQFPRKDDEAPLVEALPALLELTPDEVIAALEAARVQQRVVVLARGIPHEVVLRIKERQQALPGVHIASSSIRKYAYGDALAHIIGYTGTVSAPELAADLTLLPTAVTGKVGLEKQYDHQLRGHDGVHYVEVNAAGQQQKFLGERSVIPGDDLTLTVDAELQQFIYEQFKEAQEKNGPADPPVRGAVIALDAETGAVRALVNFPTFDANLFAQPGTKQLIAPLFENEEQPLFARATDGTYPPGSTIKPLLAAAALEEGIITPATTVLSTGGIRVGPWNFPDWKNGGHGTTNVIKALAESVNTFFYLLAGGDDTHEGLGVERMKRYLALFGWGLPTGIDLPSEAAGFLPSPQWKEESKHEPWYIGDTYHLGIGQGDVLVTPLQVAVATAAIAKGGNLPQPYLVAAHQPVDKKLVAHQPDSKELPLRAATWATVKEGMRAAVTEGSGRGLAGLPLPIAGKTGTAQIGNTAETHAWFTSFAPYDEPKLVVTVLLEEGGEGDDHAVPFARDIWEWWIAHRTSIGSVSAEQQPL